MSYNSKYTGQQVEDLLDQVSSGIGGGDAPDLSGYATKTELEGKVDKVDGKQLSTEDFTTALKQRLEGLSNYDDTEIQEAVSKLRTDLDTLVSGDTTTAIKTFNEVIAFLDGISDTEDLSGIIASIEQQIAAKQEKLVSGTNIKTINGVSVLGEGNIEIKGGGAAYPRVDLTVYDTYYTLSPNTFYVWDAVGDPLEISLGDEIEGVMNEYVFQFTAGIRVVSLILPDTIRWVEDGIYAIVPGCTYRVSIINGFAKMIMAFPYEDDSVMPMTLLHQVEFDTPPSENPKAALLYSELMRAKGDDGVVLLEEGMLYLIYIQNNDHDESNSITSVKWGTWKENLHLDNDRTVTGFLLARFGNTLILGEDGTIYWLDASAEQV